MKTTSRKKLNRCIEISKALFRDRTNIRTFHVTFAIRKNKILAIGTNSSKTHPLSIQCNYGHDVGIHSELDAILKLDKINNAKRITFVNVRLKKDKTVANSKPCRGCQKLLRRVGYRQLLYTNDSGEFEKFA